MSEPFLTTLVAGMRVAVEVAWGADLTDLSGASWTWDDVTADVTLGGGEDGAEGEGISIVLGRPDFSSETQTATMTCTLDNRSGAYSEGGLSPHWPHVRRGTPVRVRVSDDAGLTWHVRFQGSANGFTPAWDPETGRWATVELSASGPLRRLNQGTGPGVSAMRAGTLADPSVIAYWPCEDRQHSTFVAAAVGPEAGGFEIYDPDTQSQVPGAPGDCASYSDIPSSAPLVTLVEGGGIYCPVPDEDTTSTAATVSALFGNVTNVPPYDGVTTGKDGFLLAGVILTVYTVMADSIKVWELAYDGMDNGSGAATPGRLRLRGYPTDLRTFNDDATFSEGIDFGLRDNTPYTIGLMLSQSGSTTNWQLFVRRVGEEITWATSGEDSVSGNSNGAAVTDVEIGEYNSAAGLSVGHIVVRDVAFVGTPGEFDGDAEWVNGYPGEAAEERLERLCETHGIPFTLLGAQGDVPVFSVADWMGPQFYDTLTNLLRECERSGRGLLYDGLDPGLTYVSKRRRENHASGPATLTIDATDQLMEPFTPVDDDQLTINHCDVDRRGGTFATYSDLDGPAGVHAIGDYATSITVNADDDIDLVQHAQWTVGIGTQPGYRYPTISFALEVNPELIPGWLACIPTSRVDVENITAIRHQHPDETIRLLLEGWHEEITAFTWRVTANTSSADPWNVIVLADEVGSTGDAICHMDTDSSQLATSASEGATTVSVQTNEGPRWVSTAEDADSFPFDLDVGGIRATVTGIDGTTSPQTFTLAAPLPRAFTAGTPVKVWRPPVLGL